MICKKSTLAKPCPLIKKLIEGIDDIYLGELSRRIWFHHGAVVFHENKPVKVFLSNTQHIRSTKGEYFLNIALSTVPEYCYIKLEEVDGLRLLTRKRTFDIVSDGGLELLTSFRTITTKTHN